MDPLTYILSGVTVGVSVAAVVAIVKLLWPKLVHRPRRITAPNKHVSAIEQYLIESNSCYERVLGILTTWGDHVPIDDSIRRKASDFANWEMPSRLNSLGQDARSSAMILDPRLHQYLQDAEGQGVTIIPTINTTLNGQSVAHVTVQVRKALKGNQRVAARLRELVTYAPDKPS